MDLLNSSNRKRFTKKWLAPHKIGLYMITVVVLWGMYLLQANFGYNSHMAESEYLKKEIIKLSKQYVHALAQEKHTGEFGSTNTQQTAVLLQNMLDRIEQLEDQLHNVIVNSTDSFANMVRVIQNLNNTIHKHRNKTKLSTDYNCEVPNEPGYPHCAGKVDWMKNNWKTDHKYRDNGVNGTICSFLVYLSYVEDHCSKTFQIKQTKVTVSAVVSDPNEKDCMANVNDPAYPSCKGKIEWMKKFWKSDPLYASHGIDGTICSIVKFLSEVENWCPLLEGHSHIDQTCKIPKVERFPHCGDKVAWMRKFWTSDACYRQYGVNGTVCSFLVYLSEVESWCPLFPGQQKREMKGIDAGPTKVPDLTQTKLQNVLQILRTGQEAVKVDWMVSRITRLWPDWLNGYEQLNNRVKLDSYRRKRILIYIGLLADENSYHFGAQATRGGPLGELVQWSDLIAALYLLGHELIISMDKKAGSPTGIKNMLKGSISGLCPSRSKSDYDIIYTDYIGLSHIIRHYKNVNNIKCHLRIVDSFGTEAQFNHKIDKGLKNMYGFHNLNLKQYNTMFPHSPDNTFLGFIVENHLRPHGEVKKKRTALVYGKHISMWQDHKKIAFLDIIQRHFEVHATVGSATAKDKAKLTYLLPRYVVNHGVLKGDDLQKLLKETTLFVGLGFPYEGPAPLEAIANGCFFLNAKLVPPLGRGNDKFFKQKPTLRKLTSQHPYAENFIGEPYVYTVDLNDHKAVEAAMDDMELKAVEPYLPFEFTHEGMLERLYALTKHLEFCGSVKNSNETWPPISSKQVFLGDSNEACDEVCLKKDLICEPAYFPSINSEGALPSCSAVSSLTSLVAPGIKLANSNSECMLQADNLLFSCTAKSQSTKRLCPCRDFVKGQTALCSSCLDAIR